MMFYVWPIFILRKESNAALLSLFKCMYTKSKAAFIMTCNRMFDNWEDIYFWTFTFKDVYEDSRVMKFWADFSNALCRKMGNMLLGVRVVEVHPGGHGLHFHALLNQRVPMWLVRRVGYRFGIGICWVEKCDRGTAFYLAKYLSKEHQLAPGARHWGTIGGFEACRVRDIEVDSILTHNVRAMQYEVSLNAFANAKAGQNPGHAFQMDYSSFRELSYLSRMFGAIDNFPGRKFALTRSTDQRTWEKEVRVVWLDGRIHQILPSQQKLLRDLINEARVAESERMRVENQRRPVKVAGGGLSGDEQMEKYRQEMKRIADLIEKDTEYRKGVVKAKQSFN